jgi:DNA-binding YbaB/EbfC family protein
MGVVATMKNLGQMMKQAQQLQEKMGELQQQLASAEMTGSSGGGMVQVTVTGKGDVRRLKIDPSLVDPNEVEVLEDLIVAACNDAKTKVEALLQERMAALTGGLKLPPGMTLPF